MVIEVLIIKKYFCIRAWLWSTHTHNRKYLTLLNKHCVFHLDFISFHRTLWFIAYNQRKHDMAQCWSARKSHSPTEEKVKDKQSPRIKDNKVFFFVSIKKNPQKKTLSACENTMKKFSLMVFERKPPKKQKQWRTMACIFNFETKIN